MTGNIEQTTRGQDNKTEKYGEQPPFKRAQQRESPGGHHLAIFRHFANSYGELHELSGFALSECLQPSLVVCYLFPWHV